MVENDPPAEDGRGGPARDDRYYGPFGPGPQEQGPAPRGPAFETQPSSWAPPAPAPAPTPGAGPSGPPPGPSPLGPTTLGAPYASPMGATALPTRRRRGGAGSVVAVAALTALLIGGTAGYGGALLAGRSSAAPLAGTTAAPSSDPVDPQPTDPQPTDPQPSAPQSSASASPLPSAPAQANTVEIAKRVLPGTVMIKAGNSTGSGFVLDGSGRIMTNNHVVAGASGGDRLRVISADGRERAATLVGRSPSYDLAVIKVSSPGGLTALPAGSSKAVQVGQPVIAVGAPLGLPGTVTQGIVSARDRPVVVNADGGADSPTAYINAIQTDAPINPGNSGGPLIDSAGRVIGVNSAILTLGAGQGQQTGNIGLGFAIPIDQATSIGRQLIARGKARYPVIGATVGDGGGAPEIKTVERGGPAADAGLRAGDLVTKIDGRKVATMEELIVTVRTHTPGEVVDLTYRRGSASRSAKVTLGGKEG